MWKKREKVEFEEIFMKKSLNFIFNVFKNFKFYLMLFNSLKDFKFRIFTYFLKIFKKIYLKKILKNSRQKP